MIKINKCHTNKIITHSKEEYPNEACGILAGVANIVKETYRITNTAKSPYRYTMDPQEFLNTELDAERREWDLIAFYHSHTHSAAYPSNTDVRMALQSGWLDIYYIVISLENISNPDLKAFHIDNTGTIVEKKFQIF